MEIMPIKIFATDGNYAHQIFFFLLILRRSFADSKILIRLRNIIIFYFVHLFYVNKILHYFVNCKTKSSANWFTNCKTNIYVIFFGNCKTSYSFVFGQKKSQLYFFYVELTWVINLLIDCSCLFEIKKKKYALLFLFLITNFPNNRFKKCSIEIKLQ